MSIRIIHSNWFPPKPFAAITLGHTIIWRRDEPITWWLVSHELAHVRQYERLGFPGFLFTYLWQAATAKLRHADIPLEIEADRMADSPELIEWAKRIIQEEDLI